MKRIFLIFVILFSIVFGSFAGALNFKAVAFNSKLSSHKDWKGWERSSIPITWDYERKHLEIYSYETQIFDYSNSEKKVYSNYTLFTVNATDSKYYDVLITFQFFTDGKVFITIVYPTYMYTYSVVAQEY